MHNVCCYNSIPMSTGHHHFLLWFGCLEFVLEISSSAMSLSVDLFLFIKVRILRDKELEAHIHVCVSFGFRNTNQCATY